MNTGLRFDWLTLAIHGDLAFKESIFQENYEPIQGIPMYLHGFQGDFYRIYCQDDVSAYYPIAILQFDHALLWGGRYDTMFDILAGISALPGFEGYHVTRVDLSVLVDHNFFGNGLESFLSKCRGKVKLSNVKHVGAGGETETVYLGSRQKVFLRIYDKLKELLSHDSVDFKDYVYNEVKDWRACYNVEFELRRQWLKDFGIKSLGDLMGMMESGELWKYLTGNWFYMCDGDYISRVWEEIKGVQFMNDGKMYEEVVDMLVRDIDPERLYAAMKGMLRRLSYVEEYRVIRSHVLEMIEGVRSIDRRDREKERRFKVRRSEDTDSCVSGASESLPASAIGDGV